MIGENAFVDLAMGGGRRSFFNVSELDFEGESGERLDGRNLIEEAEAAGIITVGNTEEFEALELEE